MMGNATIYVIALSGGTEGLLIPPYNAAKHKLLSITLTSSVYWPSLGESVALQFLDVKRLP